MSRSMPGLGKKRKERRPSTKMRKTRDPFKTSSSVHPLDQLYMQEKKEREMKDNETT